ncbi:hypothetical protein Hanom_Chr11g01014111 [Helianthus anomalus]
MEHNPTYDKLPHIPNRSFIQGSRMDNMDNCHKVYLMYMPPAERLYQKRRDWWRLLDTHVHLVINSRSTTQEIVREWKWMGEQIAEFEDEKRAFAVAGEKINAEERGLHSRVTDAEEKLSKEQKLNAERQQEWTTACVNTYRDLNGSRDEALKCSCG